MLKARSLCPQVALTLGLGIGIVGVYFVGDASADTSLVATGEVSSGYSDNILQVGESDDPDAPEVVGDAFMDLAPGLAVAHQRRRSTHNLIYTFGARLLLDNSEASSISNTLGYTSVISLSPRTSLRLGAGFNSGRVNGFDATGNNVVQPGNVLPEGDVAFISYNANAAVRHLLTPQWSTELAFASAIFEPTNTTDVGSTRNAEVTARAERRYRYHLVGADLRTAFNRQEVPDIERSLTISPGAFWTWDISERVSTTTSAGIDTIGEYPTMERSIVVPRGAAALTYSHTRGRATTGVARGIATNLFGGDTTVTTLYFLNFGLPVPIKRPTVAGLAFNYAKGEIIDVELGDTRGRTDLISANITLQTEINRAWRVGFRFDTSKQDVADIGVMGDFETTIRVTTASLVLTGRFPEQIAGQVPARSSDRTDSSTTGFDQPGSNRGSAAGEERGE